MYFFYKIITNFFLLISPIFFFFRILKGKEDKKSLLEKYCIYSTKNFEQTMWIHAASVGEMMSVLPIINRFEKSKKFKKIILTTNTISSAKIFKKLNFKKTYHRYYPLDSEQITNKFINHWRPKIAIFVDSEIWPNILKNLNEKKIPIVLLNGRITRKSFNRWRLFPSFAKKVFGKITLALPQNYETKKFLKKLGVNNIKIAGNLKYYGKVNFKKSNNKFSKFKIWCAVSTHPKEENIIGKIHLKLKQKYKNLLTIIIPRHTHRSDEIIRELNKYGLNVIKHSLSQKLKSNNDIYIVDTYGEASNFFSLSNITFVGGSLIKHGGQNPLEPARYGNYILTGPNVDNFKEVYSFLKKNNLSTITTSSLIMKKIIEKKINYSMSTKNKKKILEIGDEILKKNLLCINSLIK